MAHEEPPLGGMPGTRLDRFTAPVRAFLKVEAAGGLLLLLCTAIALVLANSPLADAWHHLWETRVGVSAGAFSLSLSLHHWVNDGLMAIFFFVIGLEIKREIVGGELSDLRSAALPVAAAIGGAVGPAAIYLAWHAGTPEASGWGVPMATDIAFVVGALALLGDRVPRGLKVLLLSLAIVDDLLAIVVIALFYSEGVGLQWLLAAVVLLATVVGLLYAGVRTRVLFLPLALAVWYCTYASGIHPTIAGVALGLLTPMYGRVEPAAAVDLLDRAGAMLRGDEPATSAVLRNVSKVAREAVSPLERLEKALHPWTAFVVMPIFALANAGVHLSPEGLGHPVSLAVAAGLVVGKPVGIVATALLAVKSGLGRLPAGVTWAHVLGGGCLAGIGFTMSLFIASLAMEGDALDAARSGVLLASAASALLGLGLLGLASRRSSPAA